jgi:hypothetical protein
MFVRTPAIGVVAGAAALATPLSPLALPSVGPALFKLLPLPTGGIPGLLALLVYLIILFPLAKSTSQFDISCITTINCCIIIGHDS